MPDVNQTKVIRNWIRDCVADVQGIKAVSLVIEVTNHFQEWAGVESVTDIIWSMVEDGELIEIEYILSRMDYRVKSFLLPGDTRIVHHPGGNKVGYRHRFLGLYSGYAGGEPDGMDSARDLSVPSNEISIETPSKDGPEAQ